MFTCNSLLYLQGVVQLTLAIAEEEKEDHIQAAAAWALGQIGRHTPEHAKAVAVANVLPKLLQCYLRADASEDLQTKVSVCQANLILLYFNYALSQSLNVNWENFKKYSHVYWQYNLFV